MKKYLLIIVAMMLATVIRATVIYHAGCSFIVTSETDHTVELVYYSDIATEVKLPDSVTNNGTQYAVTSIGEYAIKSRYLTSVIIPNTVTKIGVHAFSSCISLPTITIPKSVTEIGDAAFVCGESLKDIYVEDGNRFYCSDNGVLYNSDMTELVQCPGGRVEFDFPNTVTKIGDNAFSYCIGLTTLTIPNSVTSIGDCAFSYCTCLSSVTIPNSVTTIGERAFSRCTSLTTIAIPHSVTEIGVYAFESCRNLTSVTIPNSITTIGSGVFHDCSSLITVTIPNSVTSIGVGAFFRCTGLTSVTIPKSMSEFDVNLFCGCTNLTKIIDMNPTPQIIGRNVFVNVPADAVIYIPKGSYKDYTQAEGWSYFSDFREMGAFDITLSASNLELGEGESAELMVNIVKDDDVTAVEHEWLSSNSEVAAVADGKVTAIAPGKAVITYIVYDSYGTAHSESCTVTVTDSAGIDDILNDTSIMADVYNMQGVAVLRNARTADIDALPSGLYIVRRGNKAEKVFKKHGVIK
ncbi:MAG: leucine-rich repeat protein [Bacteroidales bacterium]|nr:leucine-rich repeat protein [Bacteroidales bacterium]